MLYYIVPKEGLIMKNMNSNISSLFGSLNTGNSLFNSVNFTDYAAIKSGSYKKLLKAHYAEEKNAAKETADTKTASKTNAASKKDTTALSEVKKNADALKTSAEALNKEELFKKTDGAYDTEKIMGAVKDFANNYNKTLDATSKVSSKNISSSVKNMKSMTDVMKKTLAKAGVSVAEDGKLSVDEDKFKKADMGTVKSLFRGAVTYGSQTADKAGEISKNASSNSNLYTPDATPSTTMPGIFDFRA